jgi:hypothetical protein
MTEQLTRTGELLNNTNNGIRRTTKSRNRNSMPRPIINHEDHPQSRRFADTGWNTDNSMKKEDNKECRARAPPQTGPKKNYLTHPAARALGRHSPPAHMFARQNTKETKIPKQAGQQGAGH